MCCFNVGPNAVESLRFRKNGGEYSIKYMTAALIKEALFGEFFVEFEESIESHKVIEGFHSLGAGQVTLDTFGKDGGEGAANCLLRIMNLQIKTEFKVSRGICSKALLDKVQLKQKAEAETLSKSEFDEKTKAALMASLEGHSVKLEVIEGGMHAIGDNVQMQKAKLEAMEGGMESQKVDIGDIKQGVCNVIPDYQKEIKTLKDALDHKTKQCDQQEYKTAQQTQKVNLLEARLQDQCKREKVFTDKIKELEHTLSLYNVIEELKNLTQIARDERSFERSFAVAERTELKQCILESQEVAKTLHAIEERESKRQRS